MNHLTVQPGARALWGALLLGIAVDLALVGARVLLYPAVVTLPGGWIYLFEPVVLLSAYAGLGWWLTSTTSPAHQAALRAGTLFGVLSGGVWIANLVVETFADL